MSRLMLLLVCASTISCQPRGRDLGPSEYALSPDERRLAAEIASQTDTLRAFAGGERVYLTEVEFFRDKDEVGGEARRALVSHYRYRGDVTLLTEVDLKSRSVVRQESLAHVPTPLSNEEFERAKQLALADPEVLQAIAAHRNRLKIEPLVSRASEGDSLYGHRVVRLLFRVGVDYLTRPIVHVDLTAGRVLTEPSR